MNQEELRQLIDEAAADGRAKARELVQLMGRNGRLDELETAM